MWFSGPPFYERQRHYKSMTHSFLSISCKKNQNVEGLLIYENVFYHIFIQIWRTFSLTYTMSKKGILKHPVFK